MGLSTSNFTKISYKINELQRYEHLVKNVDEQLQLLKYFQVQLPRLSG